MVERKKGKKVEYKIKFVNNLLKRSPINLYAVTQDMKEFNDI